jgi:hypothetical protein
VILRLATMALALFAAGSATAATEGYDREIKFATVSRGLWGNRSGGVQFEVDGPRFRITTVGPWVGERYVFEIRRLRLQIEDVSRGVQRRQLCVFIHIQPPGPIGFPLESRSYVTVIAQRRRFDNKVPGKWVVLYESGAVMTKTKHAHPEDCLKP